MSTDRRTKELADHLLTPLGIRTSTLANSPENDTFLRYVRSAVETGRENDLANRAQWKDQSGRKH